jgi:trans-aconitate methyltransferase
MTTYFQLKEDIRDVRTQQDTQNRINDIRLKVLEDHVNLLQKQIDELQDIQSQKSIIK